MGIVIKCNNVVKNYDKKKILKHISFNINKGECIALLGPNGAGKTTLLNIMLKNIIPTSGKVKNEYKLSEIGYLTQNTNFPDDIKVRELIEFVSKFSTHPLNPAQVDNILRFSPETMVKISSKLSGGQKRLLDFCLSIINSPQLLVLDEPTSGMDEDTRRHFWKIIANLKKEGVTVIFTTHYSDEVNNGADRVLLLKNGCLVADESPFHLRALNNKRTLTFERVMYNTYLSQFKTLLKELGSLLNVINKKETIKWKFDRENTNRILSALLRENIDMRSVELSNTSLLGTIFKEGEKENDSLIKNRMA